MKAQLPTQFPKQLDDVENEAKIKVKSISTNHADYLASIFLVEDLQNKQPFAELPITG